MWLLADPPCLSRHYVLQQGQMGFSVFLLYVCTEALVCLRFAEGKDWAGAINSWTG